MADVTPHDIDELDPAHCFFPPEDSPQRRALESDADIVLFGGANGGGKTAALVAAASRGIEVDPHWTAVVFRRTYPELSQEGGIEDQSQRFYPNPSDNYNKSEHRWEFPSGATINLSHMKHPDDCEDWDGAELAFIGFDQLESFTQRQFFYLMGRARAPASKFTPQIWATCNPAKQGYWLYNFVKPWLDDSNSFPDPEEAGTTKYFHRRGDDIRWASGPDDLNADGDAPTSVAFFPATVDDNPHLGSRYKQWLNTLGETDRLEKRYGKWGVTSDDSPLSDHQIQLKSEDEIPDDYSAVRYWDLADSEQTPENPNPSHTAGTRGGVIRRQWTVCTYDGGDEGTQQDQAEADCKFWSEGAVDFEVCPRCGHEELMTKQMPVLIVTHSAWFRKSGDAKKSRMRRIAESDGRSVTVAAEQEPGSSGKEIMRQYREDLFENFDFESDKTTGSKAARLGLWRPLAETGRLWVMQAPFAESFFTALENAEPFDVIDSVSGLYKIARNKLNSWGYS